MQKLLINGFISEIFENIPEEKIKAFVERQYRGTDRWNLIIH